MSTKEVDDYLAGLDEPKRRTLEQLRASISALLPDAEQGLAYGVPAFKVGGKAVAGFTAAKDHLSYLPHSGSVLAELSDDRGRLRDVEGLPALRRRLPAP